MLEMKDARYDYFETGAWVKRELLGMIFD